MTDDRRQTTEDRRQMTDDGTRGASRAGDDPTMPPYQIVKKNFLTKREVVNKVAVSFAENANNGGKNIEIKRRNRNGNKGCN